MKTSVLPQRSGSNLSGLPAIIVFILLEPFYLWNSSLPQIGPLTFAVMFIGVFMSGGLVIDLEDKFQVRAVLYIALFAGWALIVDGLYSVTEHTIEPVASAPFYAFGLLVTLVFLTVMNRGGETAARAIYYAFAFGAITQAMIAAAGLGRMYFNLREMNFFDNPNQLGYFAVLTSVYLTYFGRQLKINFAWQNFALICAAYICFRSLSRAGAAAIVATILLDYALFERNRIRWFVILFVSVVVGGLYAESIRNAVIDAFVNSRFAGGGIGAGHSGANEFMEYRHYEYLLAESSRLLVGWGDGQFQKHFGGVVELHATLPAILLCFGVPGITLFLLLIWNSVRANWKDAIVTLGPLLVYGFTHNGSRNPMLFAIFAVVAAQPFKKRVAERERAECSIAD
jgi:hypothetical protein